MLLGLAPLGVVFILATAGFGAMMLKEYLDRQTAPKGHTTRPKEGEIVSSEFVNGSYWVVKVYYSKLGYEVQVLHEGEFQTRKTGFPTEKAANAWGVSYAKQHGA